MDTFGKRKLSWAEKAVLACLIALALVAVVYAVHVWVSIDAQMSGFGWGMLIMGIIISMAVGVGLMWLVYYSAKHDMDR